MHLMTFVAKTYENMQKWIHINSTQSKIIMLHLLKLLMKELKTNNVNTIGEIK